MTLFFVVQAFPISRWGNGSSLMSADQRLTIEVPTGVLSMNQVSATKVGLVVGIPGLGFGLGTSQISGVWLDEFASSYPEYAGLSQDDLRNALAKSQASWQEQPPLGGGCVLNFKAVGGNSVTTLLIWGPGQGLVISALENPTTERIISQIESSIRLVKGCAWNQP